MVPRMDAATRLLSPASRAEYVRLGVGASTMSLAAIGLLLISRRVAGAFAADLGAGRLALTLLLAAAIVCGGRVLWRRAGGELSSSDLPLAWTGSLALWLLCLGCAPPSAENFAWLLWTPLVVADHFSRLAFLGVDRKARARTVSPTSGAIVAPLDDIDEIDAATECVLQQLTRIRTDDGAETIRGTVRAEFAVGQQHATLHVGFCPPLAQLPEVAAEPCDGPEAEVKVVQSLAHGARLEVRLPEPANEPCSVCVEFAAIPNIARPSWPE